MKRINNLLKNRQVNKLATSLAAIVAMGTTVITSTALASVTTTEFRYKHESLSRYHYASMKEIADDVNPADGSLTIAVTDISLPGNNDLKVELRRTLEASWDGANSTGEFGWRDGFYSPVPQEQTSYWTLDLPFIRAYFMKDAKSTSQYINQSQSMKRNRLCSDHDRNRFDDISWSTGQDSRYFLNPFQYWDGLLLHIPGATTEKLVERDAATDSGYFTHGANQRAGEHFTKSNYVIKGCQSYDLDAPDGLDTTYEGFKIASPDGKLYTFGMAKDFLTEFKTDEHVHKWRRMMLLTEVSDKWGNFVTYNYDDNKNLTTIEGSDGRKITINYEAIPGNGWRINSAEANGRTWDYVYDDELDSNSDSMRLAKVIRPDNKFWQYTNARALVLSQPSPNETRNGWCFRFPSSPESVFTVKDPDGVVTKYSMKHTYQGTSNTKTSVDVTGGIISPGEVFPTSMPVPSFKKLHCSHAKSLVKKEVFAYSDASGNPTGNAYEWTYGYSQNDGYYQPANEEEEGPLGVELVRIVNETSTPNLTVDSKTPAIVQANPQDYKTTTVTSADYIKVYYVDRNAFSLTQNKPIVIDTKNSTGELLKREVFHYQAAHIGDDMMRGMFYQDADTSTARRSNFDPEAKGMNHLQMESRAELTSKVTTLFNPTDQTDSTTYTTNYSDHTIYGAAQTITEFNSTDVGRKKYTKQGFSTNVSGDRHYIDLPTTKAISAAADSGFVTVSETVYGASVYYSPIEYKQYGTTISEITEYHSDAIPPAHSVDDNNRAAVNAMIAGLPKTVDFNAKTAASLGAVANGNNRKIVYTNYKRGIPQTTTFFARDSYNSTISASKVVDDNGWVTSETTLKNIRVNFGRDSMGNITWVDLPADNTHARQWLDHLYSWSGTHNNILTIKHCRLNNQKNGCQDDTEQFRSTITYDGLLRPVLTHNRDVTNSISRYQVKSFDEQNRDTFASFWSAASNEADGTTTEYDALGRVSQVSVSHGGAVTHEYLTGNRIKVTNARGKEETTEYWAYGEPAYDIFTEKLSEENVKTSQVVDVYGSVTAITQEDTTNAAVTLTEHRAYDTSKRLCKISRTDVGTALFEYNTLGQMTAKSEGEAAGSNTSCGTLTASKKIDYTYDNLGDVYKIDYPDGHYITSLYDNHGNLTRITTPNTVRNYAYNNLDMLEDESLSIGSEKTLSLDYAYNGLGHRSSITYPDNDTVTFAPNGFGEPAQAVRTRGSEAAYNYATGASWYPNGAINTFTYGNGLTHKTTLNSRKLPQSVRDYNGGVNALYYSYGYDNNQNVTTLTDHKDSAFSLTSLIYDGLDRLTNTTGGSGIGSSTINYDGLGNITSYSSKGRNLTYTYNYTQNRLTGVSDSIGTKDYPFFSYDDRGNITNTSFNGLTFNRANQVTAATTTTGSSNSFVYDGHNRRVKKTSSNGIEYSFYGQDGTLLYRESQANGGGINYIYLGKKLIAKDGFIPEDSGQQHYRPYGDSIEGAADDVGYTGHKFDKDLGLSYMQARYYDPVIGRFYSNDPVGFTGEVDTFSRYSYVANNPYKYTDPNGESKKPKVAMQAESGGYAILAGTVLQLVSEPGSSMHDLGKSMVAEGQKMMPGRAKGAGKRKIMKPVEKADGAHTVMKKNNKGEITNHQTFEPNTNPNNPNKFVKGNRTDVQGKGEFNKATGEMVETPHTHTNDPNVPGGLRSATIDEIPKPKN